MKALVLDAEGQRGSINDVPAPEPRPNEVLVQVRAIALNPVAALYTAHPLGESGRILGSDFAGEVVALGSSVPPLSMLRTGSRVAGFLQGACSINGRPGAFAEYLAVPWDLVWRINDLSFEDAATQQVNDSLRKQSISAVINGASTSVGLYAAQLAKASPNPVTLFGTVSLRHLSLLSKSPYKYEHLVDYRSDNWSDQILQMNDGIGLDVGVDCISEGSSVLKTARTLKRGAKLGVVRSREGEAWNTSAEELGLEPTYGAVWEGLGEEVVYAGMTLPAKAQAREFAAAFYAWLSEGGNIVSNPIRLPPGGLEKVVEDGFTILGTGSMDDRRENRREEEHMRPVSGEKLVYQIK